MAAYRVYYKRLTGDNLYPNEGARIEGPCYTNSDNLENAAKVITKFDPQFFPVKVEEVEGWVKE